jgi:F-type H+-transporting ATPase subunit b
MSIDWWTLGIQFLNVAVLIWLLAHFFWSPVARLIEERRTSVEESLDQARAAQEDIQSQRDDIARTREGFEAERQELLAKARKQAEEEAEQILAQARKEADAIRDQAREAAERDRETARREWGQRASALAVDVAGRLLSTVDRREADEAFLEPLLAELRGLAAGPRGEEGAGGSPTLVLTTAAPLGQDREGPVRHRLQEALGRDWPVEFRVDEELIAGMELEGPSFTVRNSWRAALRRIHEELDREHSA